MKRHLTYNVFQLSSASCRTWKSHLHKFSCVSFLRKWISQETFWCVIGFSNLIDVFVTGPRETAHVVAAEYVQRWVVGAGARREQHWHQQLRVDDINSLTTRRYSLGRVQQVECSGVGTLDDSLHERSAAFRIPTTTRPHIMITIIAHFSCDTTG